MNLTAISKYHFLPASESEAVHAKHKELIDRCCPPGFCYWGRVAAENVKRLTEGTDDVVCVNEALDENGDPAPGEYTMFRRITSVHDEIDCSHFEAVSRTSQPRPTLACV